MEFIDHPNTIGEPSASCLLIASYRMPPDQPPICVAADKLVIFLIFIMVMMSAPCPGFETLGRAGFTSMPRVAVFDGGPKITLYEVLLLEHPSRHRP